MPARSRRSHARPTACEWFMRAWYAAESPRQHAAVRSKKAKMKSSAVATGAP